MIRKPLKLPNRHLKMSNRNQMSKSKKSKIAYGGIYANKQGGSQPPGPVSYKVQLRIGRTSAHYCILKALI